MAARAVLRRALRAVRVRVRLRVAILLDWGVLGGCNWFVVCLLEGGFKLLACERVMNAM